MITKEHQKEYFSLGYIRSIASRAGIKCDGSGPDYGFDLTLCNVQIRKNQFFETGHRIDLQVKSTWDYKFSGTHIQYDLKAKNFNDLAYEKRGTPMILVVFCLPRDENQWVTHHQPVKFDDRKVELRYGAFWKSLRGLPETSNKNTVSINIPIDQTFDFHSVKKLMADWTNGRLPK